MPNAPPDYAATFRRAFALFRHQRVVDPSTGDEAHLRPIAGLDRSLLGLPPFDGDGRDDFVELFGPLAARGGGDASPAEAAAAAEAAFEQDTDEDAGAPTAARRARKRGAPRCFV
jgi:hypothetical protein